MPHVIIKLQPGKSEHQKETIAEAVAQAVMASAPCAERAVSVSIAEIAPEDWVEAVYKPDILGGPGTLYKRPGYDPL
ncbi:4-oxalocrotonate tautomerase [Gluconacetobacter diazotrophicus]|uniref:4-oxalocrotonate tautomerase n=1 Tax=Gluconacetobacter diazotrophicus TaxID=33996 RepID=A0A7W4FCC6_GLUDI|nr:tautomerase family protein [Gluconacetobacter diazotrophicus]MBB2155155.1 4-oxalocrotonate tautomerase [Gluconacetobacter diazotrophicus]